MVEPAFDIARPIARGVAHDLSTHKGVGVPSGPTLTTEPLIITLAGDSIVGGSAPGYSGFPNTGRSTGALIARNRGRPGTQSTVSNTNFDADCLGATYPAGIVAICAGKNDEAGAVTTIAVGTADGNPGKAVYNIRDMATRALAAGKKVAVCGTPYKSTGSNSTGTDFIDGTLLTDITDPAGLFYSSYQAGNIIFVDFRPVLSNTTTKLTLDASYYYDVTHPSDLGGALLEAALETALAAAGWISASQYPYTRNQSISSDARNIITAARGTMQGTGGTGGAAQGWQLITNTDTKCSIALGNAAPSPSLGNVQRVTIGAGAASNAALQFVYSGITGYIGRRIRVMFRTRGTGLFAQGASFQPKVTTSGGNNFYPVNGAATLLPAGKYDGDVFHACDLIVPVGATNLTVQMALMNNPGASDVTVDIYDLLVMDIGT